MLLRLFNSGDRAMDSQLVQFAKSYEVCYIWNPLKATDSNRPSNLGSCFTDSCCLSKALRPKWCRYRHLAQVPMQGSWWIDRVGRVARDQGLRRRLESLIIEKMRISRAWGFLGGIILWKILLLQSAINRTQWHSSPNVLLSCKRFHLDSCDSNCCTFNLRSELYLLYRYKTGSHCAIYRSVKSMRCPVSKNWVSLIILADLSRRLQKECTSRYMTTKYPNLLYLTLITVAASRDTQINLPPKIVLVSSYHTVRDTFL